MALTLHSQEKPHVVADGLIIHPDFEFADANFFFQARHVIFPCHRGVIQGSIIWGPMLKLPAPGGETQDGMTALQPLFLHDTEPDEVALVLKFFYFRWPGPKLTSFGCLRLYLAADKFSVPRAQEYAVEALGKRSLPAIFKLQCGLRCNKLDWARQAFDVLMCMPLHLISDHDAFMVSPDLVFAVAKAHSVIENHRRKTFVEIPKYTHHALCFPGNHASCLTAWRLSWCSGLGRLYLNPGPYMSISDIKQHLAAVSVPNMTVDCLNSVKAKIFGEQLFEKETKVINDEFKKITWVGLALDRWEFPAVELFEKEDDDEPMF